MTFIPILAYHSVAARTIPGFEDFTVSPHEFEEQMQSLTEQGYRALRPAEILAAQSGVRFGRAASDRLVGITFDDGLADFVEDALPILQRYGLAASLFVPTAYVGGRSTWMANHGRLLDWADLRDVRQAGVEIGAHSHSHLALDLIENEQLGDEMRRSKATIEDRLGVDVPSVAYPYGLHSRRVRRAAAAAGFSVGFAVSNRVCESSDGRLALPRLIVPPNTSGAELLALMGQRFGRTGRAVHDGKRTLWAGWRRASRRARGFDPAVGPVGRGFNDQDRLT